MNKASKEKSIFITATNTDVGKTYAAKRFLKHYAKKGYKVGYFKPIETGVDEQPLDGLKMYNLVKKLNPDFKPILEDVVPYRYRVPASPFVSKKYEPNIKIDIKFIKEQKKYLQKYCDILVIEGAGGLMVPIKKNYFMVDLIKDLKTKAILITPSRLGCINDTLLSIETLKRAEVPFEWYVNLFLDKERFEKITLPFYEEYFKKIEYLHNI